MKQVFNSIYNFFFAILQEKAPLEVRISRRISCDLCPYKKDDFKLLKIQLANVPQCDICKCPIKNKTAFKYSKCPKELWEE